MNRREIIKIFESLALSQGFYGRLLRDVYSMDDDEAENFWANLEAQNFKSAVDVVMFIEG